MHTTQRVRESPSANRDDVPGLLAAIREFHRLRSRAEHGEQTTQAEAGRLRELRDLLEPRRSGTAARSRVEVSVDERAVVMADGRSRPARLKLLALRRVELDLDSPLTPGERVVLSIVKPQVSFHFHARVVRSRRDGFAVAEILAASLDG